MSDSERTPGPYTYEGCTIMTPDDSVLAAVYYPEDDKIADANTAFIVTACNNFDALLAACKSIAAQYSKTTKGDYLNIPVSMAEKTAAMNAVEAAIKAAKGE